MINEDIRGRRGRKASAHRLIRCALILTPNPRFWAETCTLTHSPSGPDRQQPPGAAASPPPPRRAAGSRNTLNERIGLFIYLLVAVSTERATPVKLRAQLRPRVAPSSPSSLPPPPPPLHTEAYSANNHKQW